MLNRLSQIKKVSHMKASNNSQKFRLQTCETFEWLLIANPTIYLLFTNTGKIRNI